MVLSGNEQPPVGGGQNEHQLDDAQQEAASNHLVDSMRSPANEEIGTKQAGNSFAVASNSSGSSYRGKPVTVTASHVSFSVGHYKGQGLGCFNRTKEVFISPTGQPVGPNDRIELLHDISFVAKPYELTAIMGPSGCGKTTLLNLLSCRARGRKEAGSIKYNGREVKGRSLQSTLHQVYANDKFLPYLTVQECLMFSAVLKLGQTTHKVRKQKVEEVMDELALRHVAHTCCGGSWRKGLSTGELRRLTIGMELIGNPRVVLLDEPTSGLDAVLSYEIVYLLKQVALRGRTVICSVHQPRSSIFELFDNLVLLGRGWCLYSGPVRQAPLFFRDQLGLTMDQGRAVADSLIDLASDVTEPYPLRLTNSDNSALDKICERLERSEGGGPKSGAKTIRSPGQAIRVAHEFSQSEFCATLHEDIQQTESQGMAEFPPDAKFGELPRNPFVQWWLEVYAVSTRSFFNNWRNPLAFAILVLVQVIIGLFLGIICWQLPRKFITNYDLTPLGNPDSPIMQLFNNTAVHMFTTGIDQTGNFPLFQMIIDGVDGNGSQPLSAFAELSIWPRYKRVPDCAFRALDVEQMGIYPTTDLSDYNQFWPKDGPQVPGMVSTVMQALQLIDFAVYERDWSDAWFWAHNTTIRPSCGVDSLIVRLQCTGIIGDVFRQFGSCAVEYPDPPARDRMLNYCSSWSDFPNWYAERIQGAQPKKQIEEGGLDNFSWRAVGNHLPSLVEFDDFQKDIVTPPQRFSPILVDPSAKLKARKAIAEKTTAPLPDRDASADASLSSSGIFSEKAGAGDAAASPRRLQAGALMAGGLESFRQFLPDAAVDMFVRLNDYMTAVRSCDHDFCRALDRMLSNDTTMTTVTDYAMILVALLNIVGGSLFFAVMNIGFAAFDALVSFPQERAMYNRECANKMYHTSSYFLGKMMGDWIFQIVPVTCLVAICFFMQDLYLGVDKPVSLFFAYYGICLLTSWSCYGFTYLIAAASPVMEVSVTAAPLFLSLLMATSGFFVRDSAVPSGLTWMKYLSTFRWGYFALCLLRFPVGESWQGLPNSFALVVAGITEFSLAKCCWWIFGIGAVLRIIAFLFLKYLHRQYGIEQ